jgi:Superfamily I DNA and RNA helicases
MSDIQFLNDLNDNQRAAVEYIDGPSLVIAGAGSGKTRVLTYKVAYLMKCGLPPTSILALTFTNKAAREMKSRIANMVNPQMARYLWMGTFHSIFGRILRNEADKIGFTKNFTIYDSADSNSLIKAIVKELQLDEKQYKPSAVHGRISMAKNNLVTSDKYANSIEQRNADKYAKMPAIYQIYEIYTARCRQADAMDFDDLLLLTNVLFRNHPDVLQKYQNAFSYILVDEYQDTNFAQYLIIKKLAEQHERICVVGDDAQSIYSFRGANIDNILKFQNSYTRAKVFKLEQNYRSTQNIVNAANSLIYKNQQQIHKNVFSENNEGERIKLISVFTDLEEGVTVADNITDLNKIEKYNFSEIAILYRTNAQSRVLEDSLRKKNIPYRIYGGLSFYQRKEIKDVIAYCRLVCNRNDEEALKRIINVPARGIGDTTVNKLFECSIIHAVSVWEILNNILGYNLSVNSGTAAKLTKFREMIDVFGSKMETINVYDLMTEIVKVTGIINDTYTDKSPESQSRRENVEELLTAAHNFLETRTENGETALLTDFLSDIALLTDQDTDKDEKDDKVTMMTIHSAKGLEFKAVFVVGMEEGLFPSPYCQTPSEIEEERRLFYVAITRAELRCVITYSKSRFRNGTTNFSNPSRFLQDIDTQYIEKISAEDKIFSPRKFSFDDEKIDFERNIFNKTKIANTNSTNPYPSSYKKLTKISDVDSPFVPIDNPTYSNGTMLRHSIFGVGQVISSSFVGNNEKVEIDFGKSGKKSLLLKFAKLERI